MKYSMTQWIFGGEPLDETLGRLKKMGFDGIELIPEPERFPDPKQTRALLDEHGIEPSMMDLTPFHDLSHPDENERKKAIEINKQMLDITAEQLIVDDIEQYQPQHGQARQAKPHHGAGIEGHAERP